jgi:primosomal protein N' (replication factor Y)
MFAEIAFNRPIEPLTYRIPGDMSLKQGMRVRVDLRNSDSVGIVYRLSETTGLTRVKEIEAVLDREPVLNDDLFETAEWIARYYLCSIGEALWTIVPKGIKRREKKVRIDDLPVDDSFSLTAAQKQVLNGLLKPVEKGTGRNFLLYGVTGSGKTEIYLRIIHEVVKRGLGAILLVPEISLTPQTVRYFSKRMGDTLAILHSRLTKAEKINEWYRILSGEKRIVIGARSAVFAPVDRIGIIIIDEEHETSYKSDETPRYSARSVAFFRSKRHNASLILGSATPSIESYYLAKMQKMQLLHLPERVLNQQLPKTHISDLRKSHGEKYISRPLLNAIEDRLRRSEQIILFLNRRGFSPHVYCENCGYVFRCKNCDITLTYHKQMSRLVCHYCGYSVSPPELCPNCGYEGIGFSGFGTEKIEKILNERYPGAVIVRMDTDTVKKRTALSQILTAFSKRQIDILLGTQIVSKGLHFPNVTLVGVLNADIPLNFPDFRAAERTFNLITQVSGRAGRSEKGGEVIIQTYNPVHYAIQTAKSQNYEEFFTREIKFRQALNYPPFCRIIRLVFRGRDTAQLMEHGRTAVSFLSERMVVPEIVEIDETRKSTWLSENTGDESGQKTPSPESILGPIECPISRIKKYNRIHIIIKTKKIGPLLPVLRELQKGVRLQGDAYMEIDIDPISML